MKSRGSDHSASPAPPRVTIPEPDASASQQPRDLARRATPKSGEAEVRGACARVRAEMETYTTWWRGQVMRADVEAILQAAERGMEYEKAVEAHVAWSWAEDHHALSTFQERMELCQYAQWLSEKALGRGRTEDYQGVKRLIVWPSVYIAREDQAGAQERVDHILALWRESTQALDAPCPKCGQREVGQYGEYPCSACDLPMLHGDREALASDPPQGKEEEV